VVWTGGLLAGGALSAFEGSVRMQIPLRAYRAAVLRGVCFGVGRRVGGRADRLYHTICMWVGMVCDRDRYIWYSSVVS
jgi:hypothetical protein